MNCQRQSASAVSPISTPPSVRPSAPPSAPPSAHRQPGCQPDDLADCDPDCEPDDLADAMNIGTEESMAHGVCWGGMEVKNTGEMVRDGQNQARVKNT